MMQQAQVVTTLALDRVGCVNDERELSAGG
jgi:hypothetical protein